MAFDTPGQPDWGAVERVLNDPVASKQLTPQQQEVLRNKLNERKMTAPRDVAQIAPLQGEVKTLESETGLALAQRQLALPEMLVASVKHIAREAIGAFGTTPPETPLTKLVKSSLSPDQQDLSLKPVHLSPGNPDSAMFEQVVKPILSIGTMIEQGRIVFGGLQWVSKAPALAAALEALPDRLVAAGLGALTAGTVDALRVDGIPDDPSALDPAAYFAKNMAKHGMPERMGLFIGGGITGGVIGAAVEGVMEGVSKSRQLWAAARLTPENVADITDALKRAGIEPGEAATKYQVADIFLKNLRKVAHNENTAGLVAERLSREKYIADEFLSARAENAQVGTGLSEEEGRLLAGLFRNNPGGLSIVTGLSTTEGIDNAAKRLGVRLTFQRIRSGETPVHGDIHAESVVNRPLPAQAVDELGLPYINSGPNQVVYHGAPKPFPDFDNSKIQSNLPIPGHWVSESNVTAESYAISRTAEAPNVRPVVANLNKVFDMARTYSPEEANALYKAMGVSEKVPAIAIPTPGYSLLGYLTGEPVGAVGKRMKPAEVVQRLQKLGFDGARTGNGNWMAFDAESLVPAFSRPVVNTLPVYDLIIGRPNYHYPSAVEVGTKETKRVSDVLKRLSQEQAGKITAPKTVEALILHDGTAIRGGINPEAAYARLRIQRPTVDGEARPDLALKQVGNFVRQEIDNTGRGLVIELPRKITDKQFAAIGRSVDAMKFEKVTVRAFDGSEKVLETPFGAQVQDAIATLVPPNRVSSPLTTELLKQYKNTGIFKGQAAILADGVPAEVVSMRGALKGQGKLYKVRELASGTVHTVNEKQLTLLPTTVVNEQLPTNLFSQYLSEEERNGIARLRSSLALGWGQPPKTVRELEKIASSRGFMVTSKRGGKVEVADVNGGGSEPVPMQNLKAALEYIRKNSAPLPDINSEEVNRILGGRNPGWIGGNAAPPQFGERIPVPWDIIDGSLQDLAKAKSPGYFELRFKSMRSLFRDLDERNLGLNSSTFFENIHSQMVGRQNFEARWYHGSGGVLPDNILPLDRIVKMAGRNANRELITDWLETAKNGPEIQAIERELTPNELHAAKELRRWYDTMYTHEGLGVNAEWMENYHPRMRELAPTYGNDGKRIMSVLETDFTRLPKGTDWIADHIRTGALDLYDKDPFRVAVRYLRSGSHNRFMKQSLDEAREMVMKIEAVNPPLASPLGHFILAVRGYEHMEERLALTGSIGAIIESLPGSAPAGISKLTAETVTDIATGLVYTSVQGARLNLALRNASAVFTMVFPMFGGGSKARFLEALAKAATKEGVEEALAARAISHGQGGLFAQAELRESLPETLRDVFGKSMWMYDTADQWTRGVAFHAAKNTAEDALLTFAKKVEGSPSEQLVAAAKKQLIVDTNMYLQDKGRIDQFLRLAATSPEKAAQFAGKQASDITNFLYGRGMQSRMLRTIAGRWFGQFGTWSMWYYDYLNRLVRVAAKNPEYRTAALKTLGRHAAVNAAIVLAGQKVGIDLSKWATHGALFYSGSPGSQIVFQGGSTLMRGLGDVTSGSENPMGPMRVKQGAAMIWHTMPSFVPGYFVGRDAIRMVEAEDFTQLGAAILGTRETRRHEAQRRLRILTGDANNEQPFSSHSQEVQDTLNAMEQNQPTVDVRTLKNLQFPQQEQQSGALPSASSQGQPQSSVRQNLTGVGGTAVPPSSQYRNPNESNPAKEPDPVL